MKIAKALLAVAVAFSASPLWGAAPPEGTNLGKVTGGDFSQAHSLIQQKCTQCHNDARIEAAIRTGKDMTKIQKEMETKGVRLDANERQVLGIYWNQNPLKQKK